MTHHHSDDDPILHVTIDVTPTHMYVRLSGEMDVSTSDRVRTAVSCFQSHDTHRAVIDLSDLTFCDASGLSALLALHTELTSTNHVISVEGVRPNILRILRITGIDEVLIPQQRTGDDALSPDYA
jgi:anti-sigma B factor antagonist